MSDSKEYTPRTAMQVVTEKVEAELQKPLRPAFTVHEKEHPVTCSAECMYAGALRIESAVQTVVAEVRLIESYQLEKAALKLAALATAYKEFAMRYAELSQSYPDSTASIQSLWPATTAIHSEGDEMWKQIKEQATT